METKDEKPDISIIFPVYNGSCFLDDCLRSITKQIKNTQTVELSIFNDGSTDDSLDIILKWKIVLQDEGFKVLIGGHEGPPKGVGYAKNQSIQQSSGEYLCFQDSDDVMKPKRLQLQYKAALENPFTIVGSKFERDPPESTLRYTQWANNLSPDQLDIQVYTSHGPTVIMPTWFCSRQTFDRVGGFDESGKGTPEDLIFFYRHLDLNGRIYRVDETLLTYRYHPLQTTFSVDEKSIWDIRLERLQRIFLDNWSSFTIWNAGKQGRKLYRSLPEKYRTKVLDYPPSQQQQQSYNSYYPSKKMLLGLLKPLLIPILLLFLFLFILFSSSLTPVIVQQQQQQQSSNDNNNNNNDIVVILINATGRVV